MKRAGILLAMSLFLFVSGPGTGSPVTGKRSQPGVKIDKDFKEAFRGGERACVIVMGARRPPVDVGLFIYDRNDNLVAKDEGSGFVAAIWYPPRDATYRIKITNPGSEPNVYYVVWK